MAPSPGMGLSSSPSPCHYPHGGPRHIPEVSNPMDVPTTIPMGAPGPMEGSSPITVEVSNPMGVPVPTAMDVLTLMACSCEGPSLWMLCAHGCPCPHSHGCLQAIPVDVSIPMEVPIHHSHGCPHPHSCEGPQRCPCPHLHGGPPWLSPFLRERFPFPILVMASRICRCSPLFHRDG